MIAGPSPAGPLSSEFEKDFAAYCDCRHAIGVGNGTDALWLALLALGVGPGDEVLTVPSTFMATAEAITYCGAKPVFVDIDERTYTMDPAGLEEAMTKRTKAIIPVHLFGQPADMDPILEFARAHGLFVIEDAAQAHGANTRGGESARSATQVALAFIPEKISARSAKQARWLPVTTSCKRKIRVLRDHGQIRKYHHTMVGWNCRMDGIQAAVLRIKLRHLEKGNELRRSHAAQYDRALEGLEEIVTPYEDPYARHVYHIYAIRVSERDEVIRRLGEMGIACGIHYPIPVHLQEAYSNLGYEVGSFPIAEQAAKEFVSLPMFPELTPAQVEISRGER